MTLTDAGPLIALIDAGEPEHDRCLDTLDRTHGHRAARTLEQPFPDG